MSSDALESEKQGAIGPAREKNVVSGFTAEARRDVGGSANWHNFDKPDLI